MLIVSSKVNNTFLLVEYTNDSFICTRISENFALTSKVPFEVYDGDGSFTDFKNFVMTHKPL